MGISGEGLSWETRRGRRWQREDEVLQEVWDFIDCSCVGFVQSGTDRSDL
jgi:hypothetical protein